MFSALQNKFQKLIIIIMLLVSIPFIALYFSFQHILTNDYRGNSEKFRPQIAQTLNLKLSQIEDSVNLYIFKYHLADVLTAYPSHNFLNNDLKNLLNYCPDADCAFIFDTAGNIKYYNNGSLFHNFVQVFSDNNYSSYFFSSETIWLNIDFTEQRKNYWICTMPIYSNQNIPAGYISVLIENQKFINFFSALNTDYCQNDLFYLYSDHSSDFLLKNIQTSAKLTSADKLLEAISSNRSVQCKKSIISVFPLNSDSLKLVSISKKDYINNILRKFLLLLIGIWLVLFFICCYVSAKITNQFIFDLQKLSKKVNMYTNSKKFNKKRGIIS